MKKIIYLLSLVTVFILGSCSDDLPKASWDICQVGSLNATAQDEKVLLEWAPMQGANPTGYLVNWTPEVATYEGGSVELDAKTTSYTITGLVNKVTYTITIQAIYGNQRSMISTTKARPVSDTEPFKVWSTDMPNGGMVKTANAVFSLDGNTFYLPSAGATGDVTAFDAMTGTVKWTASIPKTTYGGGVAVGKDGTLYQGARNATLYAINSDGTQKWTYATGAANKNLDCFPAVTADGQTVYILDGDNVLQTELFGNAADKLPRPALRDALKLIKLRADLCEGGGALCKALYQSRFLLDLGHGGFGTADDIPHALTGNAALLGDLGQGQIFIIMEVKILTLLFREQLAVKIKQHRTHHSAVFHGVRLPVNEIYFTDYTLRHPACQVKLLVSFAEYI